MEEEEVISLHFPYLESFLLSLSFPVQSLEEADIEGRKVLVHQGLSR